MKKTTLTLLSSILLLVPFCSQAKKPNHTNLVLLENKGQIRDQYAKPRNDIQFALRAPGISVFIATGAIHYQFSKITGFTPVPGIGGFGKAVDEQHAMPDLCTISSYRMDVALEGANKNAEVVTEGRQSYHENYYLPGCFKNGVQAHAYSKVTYKNIYPNIDWVIYLKNDHLEHEFVVRPGGDPSVIRIKYAGQNTLSINQDGSLSATTPMGTINEHAPECYNSNGIKITSKYKVQDDLLTYDIGAYTGTLVIDPMVQWASYYGPDSSVSPLYSITSDKKGGVYTCGYTYDAPLGIIVTSGAHQITYGGASDAYVVKFDTLGNRCWGTFYGGNSTDLAAGIACDTSCNVFIGGNTNSPDSIATPGCHQPVYGGSTRDGFIAKFDSAGVRQWGTYAGGSGDNTPTSVSCDKYGHVYLAGDASDVNNIATPGGFMPAKSGGFDCFLMQFSTDGVKLWGTYYGGPGNDWVGVVCTYDTDVYLSGWTPSTTGMTTLSSHQPTYGGGGTDAFLVHFDSSGARIWATYYGGASTETMGGVICDSAGDVYIFGSTGSDTAIATTGAQQTTRAGAMDAFLVKFTAATGARQWGTYYGGVDGENTDKSRLAADDSGHVFVTGFTASTSGIATSNAWQTTYGGGLDDGFFAVYTDSGKLVYSTYYGGTLSDRGYGCAFDGHAAYICGQTNSSENIATPGSFLDTGGVGGFYYQGFIAKFIDTSSPPVIDTGLVIDSNTYTGNSQLAEPRLSIFPIPNDGSFTISGTFNTMSGKIQISIADITGRVIVRDEAYINNGSINKKIVLGKHVPSGSYFAQIVHNDKAYLIKFVKN